MRRTGPDKATRDEVIARAGFCCERCGKAGAWLVIHHRKMRGRGGTSDPAINDPANLAYLCDLTADSCHRWVHANPEYAYQSGWLVHSWDDPSAVVPAPLGVVFTPIREVGA